MVSTLRIWVTKWRCECSESSIFCSARESFGGGRAERRRRWWSCLEVIVGVCDVEVEEGSKVSRDQVGLERRSSTLILEWTGRVVWKLRVRQREKCDRNLRCAMVGMIVWWLPSSLKRVANVLVMVMNWECGPITAGQGPDTSAARTATSLEYQQDTTHFHS